MREKPIAQQAGLDDGILEVLKISVLRNVPAPPLNDRTELRLIDVAEDGELLLRWVNALTEEGIVDLPLNRELYETLAANLGPWQELLDDVRKGLFVDMNRLLISPPAQGMAAWKRSLLAFCVIFADVWNGGVRWRTTFVLR